MTVAGLSEGEVEIELGDELVVLRPTLRAADRLNTRHGGFAKLLQALAGYDLAAYVDVVAFGSGTTEKARPELREAVWRAGVINLYPHLQEFVLILANGGQRATETEEAGDDASARPPASAMPNTSDGSTSSEPDGSAGPKNRRSTPA